MSTLTRCTEAYWCVTRLAPDLASDFRMAEMSWSSLLRWEWPVLARGTGWALRACIENTLYTWRRWADVASQMISMEKDTSLGRVIFVLHFAGQKSDIFIGRKRGIVAIWRRNVNVMKAAWRDLAPAVIKVNFLFYSLWSRCLSPVFIYKPEKSTFILLTN